jgi:hypothetical protein
LGADHVVRHVRATVDNPAENRDVIEGRAQ